MEPKYRLDQTIIPELENRFTYHAPIEKHDQAKRYEFLRGECKKLAERICEQCPPSRERATALTKLDEVMFFANAAIARNET